MDEDDDGKVLIIDEVEMADVVAMWSETYAEGVEVKGWYYDAHERVLLVRLLVPPDSDIAE